MTQPNTTRLFRIEKRFSHYMTRRRKPGAQNRAYRALHLVREGEAGTRVCVWLHLHKETLGRCINCGSNAKLVGSLWRDRREQTCTHVHKAKDISALLLGCGRVSSAGGVVLCFVLTLQRWDVPALQSQHPQRCPQGLGTPWSGGGGHLCLMPYVRVMSCRLLSVPSVFRRLLPR